MDADIVSKIPSKKSVGYAVASVALIYGLVYKYSIPCFACDEGVHLGFELVLRRLHLAA